MKKALTIAGSDSGGGAGIQADIKSMSANGVFAMSVITAVTAQNTLGVQGYVDIPLEYIEMQIDSIFADLIPDAVKTGMLSNPDTVALVSFKLAQYHVDNLVVDPVMVAKGGSPLLRQEAVDKMKNLLFPQALVLTPNIPEAEFITGKKIVSGADMKEVCLEIADMGVQNVLLKGGHMGSPEATDLLYDGSEFHTFTTPRIDTKNTHGTGCTMASAIAAGLAGGLSVYDAVDAAKKYIQKAIEHADEMHVGSGHGPVNHFWMMK
ncbi:bifunctional hydroxymethylpyrimidine kinase/phosphomethylpyrimidine kinase [Seleniivibrio sp.]|uniref:bifunctional hydroxymethylpyrimidine kinase/phosphomethylpyrimidine kinase n=1 Tax=Seleniivibrio sp. TaxID=2898801 RepID=UPI0025F8E9C2|nr:bifunctional hydroxymethylpyrimidine kinase/phosphomethylpyrimidine kinase [Seleniivibrio sp.]MCD8553226.1 bifunctional hydroxymethylpyrimidine kinase/phosphomethylpyrimidine kinase [Seleniivibrio sp.]